MGSEVTYINPTSLKPEIGWAPKNALAGMMYHQNEQDYRRALDQSNRLQDLNETERRYDFAEKQQGAPLREMERQLKGETIQGQLPFARDVASSTMQRTDASNKFDMKTQFSPERIRATLGEYTKNFDDQQWDKFGKENGYAASLLEQAMAIEKQRGIGEAMAYVDQRKKELEQIGFKFPAHFMNPTLWPSLYTAANESIKYRQEMAQIDRKGEWELKGRKESADATRYTADRNFDAAKARGSAAARRPSMNNPIAYVNYIETELSDARNNGDVDKMKALGPQYQAALERMWDERNKQMGYIGNVEPKIKQKLEASKADFIRKSMNEMGYFEPDEPRGGAKPAPGPREQPGNKQEALKSKYGLE